MQSPPKSLPQAEAWQLCGRLREWTLESNMGPPTREGSTSLEDLLFGFRVLICRGVDTDKTTGMCIDEWPTTELDIQM